MKKIKLTEVDLRNIIKKVINEQAKTITHDEFMDGIDKMCVDKPWDNEKMVSNRSCRRCHVDTTELIKNYCNGLTKQSITERKKPKRKPVEDSKYTKWCKEHGWEHGVGQGCADDALDSEDYQIRSWAIGFITGMNESTMNEHKVFWPDDKGKPVSMGLGTQADSDVPQQHRGMGIKLIKPRVKDWWRAEEHLWDMNVDYDKFNREKEGVTFLFQDNPVAFYDGNQKTLIVYKR